MRFERFIEGVPIYQGDIVVHFNKAESITYVAESNVANKLNNVITTIASISADDVLKKPNFISNEKVKSFIKKISFMFIKQILKIQN
ncbi:hypothetical protein ACK2M7_12075 [Chryseobacterium sp. TY4]